MTFEEQIIALDRLHNLIKRRATGTPKQLAEKFDVSVGTIKNMIKFLREKNIPVSYCRDRQTYYYECEVVIKFLVVEVVDNV